MADLCRIQYFARPRIPDPLSAEGMGQHRPQRICGHRYRGHRGPSGRGQPGSLPQRRQPPHPLLQQPGQVPPPRRLLPHRRPRRGIRSGRDCLWWRPGSQLPRQRNGHGSGSGRYAGLHAELHCRDDLQPALVRQRLDRLDRRRQPVQCPQHPRLYLERGRPVRRLGRVDHPADPV